MQGDSYHADRSMNAANLKSAFTAPADFRLESCSPESGLSELDGALELDGLELGPELQFLLESHLSESPRHSDSHLLDSLEKVCFAHENQENIERTLRQRGAGSQHLEHPNSGSATFAKWPAVIGINRLR